MVEIRVNTSYFLWQLFKKNINSVHNIVGTTVGTCHKLTGGLALWNSYGLMSYIVYSDIGLFHILYTVFYSIYDIHYKQHIIPYRNSKAYIPYGISCFISLCQASLNWFHQCTVRIKSEAPWSANGLVPAWKIIYLVTG